MSERTSFVVAHRLSTLRHATRVLVVDHSKVVGFAPHTELLRTCWIYRHLWDTQQIGRDARAAEPGAAA
jgi:ATP-binding cassette, subfamily B, bacterial HlyB/CyaB